jgi:hypothetical protein
MAVQAFSRIRVHTGASLDLVRIAGNGHTPASGADGRGDGRVRVEED